ncbi:hypothetical protein GJAV_G00249480 [Gymnothorax javanicus]|nr:hypothetical protein GJAV_G00249480 [Gymnothorax javanicus]
MFSPQGTPYGRAQSGGAARASSTFPPSPRYQVPQFHPTIPTRPCLGTPTPPHPATPSELDRAVEARLQGSREVDAQLFNQMTRDPRLRKGPEPSAWPQKGMAQETDWSSYNSPSRLFASPSIAPTAMAPPAKTVPTMAPPSNTPPAMTQLTITTPSVDLSTMTRPAQTIPGLSPPIVTPPFESPETVAGFGVGREAEPRQGSSSDVESAGSILAQFGLSSEDLELLTQYPDEQLTPETLPIILRTISVLKSKQNPLTHDDHTPGAAASPAPSPAAVPQSTVIDYGHARKPCHTVEGTAFKREPLGKDMPTGSPVRTSKGVRPGKSCQPVDIQGASRTSKKPTPDGQSRLDSPSRDKVPKTTPSPSRRSAKPDLDLRSRESKSTYRPVFPLRSPTPTMVSDYVAAPPKIFPHTCSLCNQVCLRTQDWLEHQNTNQHIDSCRNLRKKYPDWSPHPSRPSRMEEGRPRPSRSPPRSPRERSQRRNQQSRSRSPRSEPRPPKPQRRTLSPPTHTTRPSSKPRPPKASPKPSSESLVKTILKSTGMSLESLARSLGPTLLAHLKKTNPAGPTPSSKTDSARHDKTVPSPAPKSSKKLSSSAAKSHSSSSSSSRSSSARSAVSKLRSPTEKVAAAAAAPSSAKHNKCPKNGNYSSPNKDVRKKDSTVMSAQEVVSPSCKQPSAPGPTLSAETQDPRREEQRKDNKKKPTIPGAPQMEKPGAADSKNDATHLKQDAVNSKQDTTHPKQETTHQKPASLTADRPRSPRPGAEGAQGSPQVTPELLQALLRECRARAASKSAAPAPPAVQEKHDYPETPKEGRRSSPRPQEQGGESTRLVSDGEESARFDMDQFVTVDEVETVEDFVTADEFVTVDEVGEAAQEEEEPADLERGWEESREGMVMGNEVERMDGEGAVDGMEEEDGEMKVTCASAGLQKRGLNETSPFGPPLKRPRSQPLFPRDYQMPTYSPDCPIGLDFLVSKTGFLCRLCSMFYSDDEVSRKTHCSSLKHYQNMEKCLQRWREKQGSQS